MNQPYIEHYWTIMNHLHQRILVGYTPIWDDLKLHTHTDLVGGWPTPEKYESQIGSASQLLGKIIQMFQTTNQDNIGMMNGTIIGYQWI